MRLKQEVGAKIISPTLALQLKNNMIKLKKNMKTIKKIKTIIIIFCVMNSFAFSQIKITKPTTTDSLFVNENITISWEEQTKPVSIFYSENDGLTWKIIAKNIDTNSYQWKVPPIPAKKIKLKIETEKKQNLIRIYENSIAHSGNIINMSSDFSADGKYFLTASDDGYFRIWDIEKRSLFKEFQTAKPNARLYCAKFVNNVDSVVFTADNEVFLWDINTNTERKLFDFETIAFHCDIDKTRNIIAACSHNGKIILYSLQTNSILDEVYGASLEDEYYRCRFSHCGKFFAFVGYDKYVNLYDLTTKELKYFYANTGSANVIWGLDFTFDDTEICVTGLDGYIRRIDKNSMELIAEYSGGLHNSSQIRAIRYFNENNDFVSGCLGGDLLIGNFNVNIDKANTDSVIIFDKVKVGYQITDVEYFGNKYIAVAGREPRSYGKFTIFKIDTQEAEIDEVTVAVFYKNILCETDLNRNIINGKASSFDIIDNDNLIEINSSIASDDGYFLVISDISGGILLQEKYTRRGNYSVKLQKSNLSSGIYFVKLTSSIDFENIKKFIFSR